MKITRLSNFILEFNGLFDNVEPIVNLISAGSWHPWLSDTGIEIGKKRYIVPQNRMDLDLYNIIDIAIKKSIDEYFKFNKLDHEKYLYSNSYFYARKYHMSDIGMTPHSDFFYKGLEKIFPAFTICCYLTDDYRGGHLEFPNYNISVKPKSGSIIIFPSEEIHGIAPIIEGNRIMISTFIYNA